MRIHDKIAAESVFSGSILRCLKCGREYRLNTPLVSEYLSHGWPKCHEQTMQLLTAKAAR